MTDFAMRFVENWDLVAVTAGVTFVACCVALFLLGLKMSAYGK